MTLPIQYKLWNGWLWARTGQAEEWKQIYKTKSSVVTPVTQWFDQDFIYTKDTPVGWKGKWFYKDILNEASSVLIKGHNGIDMKAPTGTCLYAPEDGEILVADEKDTNKRIKLKGNGRTHYFFHLADWNVAAGDKVKEGQFIGICNNSGIYTTGSHLHWGIRPDNPDYKNGYGGFINFSDEVNFNIMKLPFKEGDLLHRVDVDNGAAGQVYVVEDGMLRFLDSEKNQATRHIPLVDHVFKLLKGGIEPNKLKGINEAEFDKYKDLVIIK